MHVDPRSILLSRLSVGQSIFLCAGHACRRYFPTILIVLLAVLNDGAMIALRKDRVRRDWPDTFSRVTNDASNLGALKPAHPDVM